MRLSESSCQPRHVNPRIQDVTANEWKPFLKELRERGCMFLAFTGGELFSYPDFCTLYEFAYDLGYKITLTTNGSLINDVHMELFKKYKPEAVFITLYGMSELTYKEFTNTTGAYKKVVNNIDKLLKNDIRVVVKYLSTTITKKDLKKAYAYAKSKKMLFYQYYKLRAFCNGDCSAKKYS